MNIKYKRSQACALVQTHYNEHKSTKNRCMTNLRSIEGGGDNVALRLLFTRRDFIFAEQQAQQYFIAHKTNAVLRHNFQRVCGPTAKESLKAFRLRNRAHGVPHARVRLTLHLHATANGVQRIAQRRAKSPRRATYEQVRYSGVILSSHILVRTLGEIVRGEIRRRVRRYARERRNQPFIQRAHALRAKHRRKAMRHALISMIR
mmetsp:Transcript_6946/g.23200  ORF Transcript_6946/g.23200 Transcript_6946/m.23200 type:complete len:204 (+) Transcript_6946:15-626(+)